MSFPASIPERRTKRSPLSFHTYDSMMLRDAVACQMRHYLKWARCLEVGKDSRPPLIFGIALHKASQHYELAGGVALHEEAVEAGVEAALRALPAFNWSPPNEKQRNARTLVRSVVALLDTFPASPYQIVRYKNGEPMVEVPFSIDIGKFTLSGHLDRVVRHRDTGQLYTMDFKHTCSSLPQDSPLSRYAPGVQFTLYNLAGRSIFPEECMGLVPVMIEVLANQTRIYELAPLDYSRSYLGKWLADKQVLLERYDRTAALAERHLGKASEAELLDLFEMNDEACYLCNFKEFCRMSSQVRARVLFSRATTENTWDPLNPRD